MEHVDQTRCLRVMQQDDVAAAHAGEEVCVVLLQDSGVDLALGGTE